jgi:integrase
MISSLPRQKERRLMRATSTTREWLPILKAKKIRPRPFYNTRHSYVSFLYSIGASSGFISKQTGDGLCQIHTGENFWKSRFRKQNQGET